jgi:hypothetical protein
MKSRQIATATILLAGIVTHSPARGQQNPVPSFKLDNAGRDVVELSGLFVDPLCHTGRVRG